MSGHEGLRNPVWASLQSDHRHVAIGGARVQRYPREFGPFVAVGSPGPIDESELLDLIAEDEEVYLVGVIPELPSRLRLLSCTSVLQMVCAQPIPPEDGPPAISPLGAQSAQAMGELTALAYPYFFRSRTHELGRYFGHWEGDRLAAMAGERMSADGYREVSGVCTHPDFVRRGYARSLIAHVVNRILEDGKLAYLHVAVENDKAQALYRQLGFVDANVVPMAHVRRVGAAAFDRAQTSDPSSS